MFSGFQLSPTAPSPSSETNHKPDQGQDNQETEEVFIKILITYLYIAFQKQFET